ncbi:PP2C family serine/threonine-protein phosphatase [Amycolatopsis sp. CA-128772]|uniref:PP2C family protein-serine/threonine phosphatase n=1 Tax=Amycolatopsis sp. CA-128772 TaxID=2073159 RepID=UPI000CD2474A|nr:PP2C family serine/threonine-protein phosphatase [Amycolatopsis sp. CA-128772]
MTAAAGAARVRVTVLTHRGAAREANEDAVVVGSFTACGVSFSDPVTYEVPLSSPVVIAVADGMGGHAAGEVASAHAVRMLAFAAPQDETGVEAALVQIDTDLVAAGRAEPAAAPMGTTVAGVLLTAAGGTHFGVGDSRVYLESGGYLAQVSTDDRGPLGGLSRCLGGRTDGTPLRTRVGRLAGADRLLLCSDGLSDLVGHETLEELLGGPGGPARVVKSLWAAAMNASGADNITVVLVELPGSDS